MALRSARPELPLLTVHGQVLIAIADNPRALLRKLAEATGITECTAQTVIADLDAAGYLTRERTGRRNRYTIHPGAPLRHARSGIRQVGPVLELLTRGAGSPDDYDAAADVSAGQRHQG